MRREVIVVVALLVAYASASPVSLARSEDEKTPLKVVDVPAGMFENPEDEKSTPELKETEPVKLEAPVKINPIVEDQPEKLDEKPVKEGESNDEEGQGLFGFKFPSIIIFRRPAIVRDPFSSFFQSSPFFSGRPTSSIFSGRPQPSIFTSSEEKDLETPVETDITDQKPNASEINSTTTHRVDDVVRRMHQQITNLWTNLFNPNNFYMPRPTFTRPSNLFPASFGSDEKENIDFDNLPANYSNSTSETKLVDGQLVTVNKTIHRVSNNNSNGFFQFSIIKIRPTEEKTEAEEVTVTNPKPIIIGASTPEIAESEIQTVTTIKNAEMDPQLNEVDRMDEDDKESKLPEVELKNKYEIENTDQVSSDSQQQLADEDIKIVPIMSAKLIKAPGKNTKQGIDLSSDIRINNMMEEAAQSGRLRALYDPEEVEVFDIA